MQLIGMPSSCSVSNTPKTLIRQPLSLPLPLIRALFLPISHHSDLRVTTETLAEEGGKHGKPADKAQHQMHNTNQSQNSDVNVYREHQLDAWKLERSYTLAVESRHGIIGTLPYIYYYIY